MALEVLQGVKKLGEFPIVVMDELRAEFPEKFNASGSMDYAWFEKDIRPNFHIYLRHDVNSLSFTFQKGPIKENGANGVQVDTLIEAARAILSGLNVSHPCQENAAALVSLGDALGHLSSRTANREARGVEGTSRA
jgi:hypothetical protein